MTPVRIRGLDLAIRPFEADDRAFVASRWIRSYGARRAEQPQELYKSRWNPLVDLLLDRSIFGGRISIACSPRTPEAILGFCVSEADVLHYVYVVPHLFRGGLGRALIEENLGVYPERIVTTHHWPWESSRFHWDYFPLIQGI